jgi:dissimilatory sulfite reductase (desulfoviridin) alpha/beta subunit
MEEGARGCGIFVGGKFGRMPFLGRKVPGVLRTPEEILAAVRAVVAFFREHGRPKERFGDTLRRLGFRSLEKELEERTGR